MSIIMIAAFYTDCYGLDSDQGCYVTVYLRQCQLTVIQLQI